LARHSRGKRWPLWVLFSTVEEALEKIRDIISNPYRHVEVSERTRLRALAFDEQIFKAKFREIIKSLLK